MQQYNPRKMVIFEGIVFLPGIVKKYNRLFECRSDSLISIEADEVLQIVACHRRWGVDRRRDIVR